MKRGKARGTTRARRADRATVAASYGLAIPAAHVVLSCQMKRVLVIPIALAALAAPPALAKKAPSFAVWTASWKTQHDPTIDGLATGCLYLFGQNDEKLGACFATREGRILHARQPDWDRQVARIAHSQSARCKKAIHGYWLATRKTVNATLVYLDSHQHTAMSQIHSDLSGDPYKTLKSHSDAAKSRAISVCG